MWESAAGAQPLFVNLATFRFAECLITRTKSSGSCRDTTTLKEADRLLDKVNLPTVANVYGLRHFQGNIAMAMARLTLLRKQPELAREYISRATPFMEYSDIDPYEINVFARVEASLARPFPPTSESP